MSLVNTVTGPVDCSGLGRTLMHEHLFVTHPEVSSEFPHLLPGQADVDQAVAALSKAADAGVETIVDLTVPGLGRRIELMQRVAARTDINIIASTGLFAFECLPPFFSSPGPGTPADAVERMTRLFVRDITEGIGGTDVRASVLKFATDFAGVTHGIELIIRAVARAHRETGVPISTHTYDAPNGLDQQRVLAEEGVDLTRVVIGHLDKAADNREYLLRLLDAGSTIGFDQFGVELPPMGPSLEARVEAIADLCARGYADQIVLSHDALTSIDSMDIATLRSLLPNHHYSYLMETGVPALKATGVSDADVDRMLIDNPRRIFESLAGGPY